MEMLEQNFKGNNLGNCIMQYCNCTKPIQKRDLEEKEVSLILEGVLYQRQYLLKRKKDKSPDQNYFEKFDQ